MTKIKNIFLSASVPDSNCDPIYRKDLDVIAIRDAVLALATLIPPKFRLILGGHPAITPIIANVIKYFDYDVNNHVTLYQSNFYKRDIRPKENLCFGNIIETEKLTTQEESLRLMRDQMIKGNSFAAAIFIGGKKGVIDEYEIFTKAYPSKKCYPIPTTGGAAKILYDKYKKSFDEELENNYAYLALFQQILGSL